MRNTKQPVYMIGVAAELCGTHPQTLRQYEKLGLIIPARVGAKNRLYSENDIARVKQIQRLTQQLGVNLAGVDIILKLLDDMEDMRTDFEDQFNEFAKDVELRIQSMSANSNAPVRQDTPLVPVPKLRVRRRFE
ncbi:MAG: helix-turn-helix transcriptional regulator [Fimbriimonadaceae bacterium]|nr:helix-turn-helix transcriptional regulator [Fimbriimonadaceae bacterium]QYK54148.1 MAG: helix-turn-helix transcriptional regulator [Fimbriimonadaceae bacterium]